MHAQLNSFKHYNKIDNLREIQFDDRIFEFQDRLMPKEDTIKIDGTVEELLPNMTFKVVLENGMKVLAHLCGKMRMRNIRVLVGDVVTVEMSPYDLTKARIIYRQR
jgi:translation initiation factor IF-1